MAICIVLNIMLAAGWMALVVDVKGAFLHGQFEDGEERYINPSGVREILFFIICPKTASMHLRNQTSHDGFLAQATQMNETHENEENHG